MKKLYETPEIEELCSEAVMDDIISNSTQDNIYEDLEPGWGDDGDSEDPTFNLPF